MVSIYQRIHPFSGRLLSSLRNRLVLMSIALTLLILPLMGMTTYFISSTTLSNMLASVNSQTAADTGDNIDLILDAMRTTADGVAVNEQMLQILEMDTVPAEIIESAG